MAKKVLVVGAGVIGASVACYLSRSGAEVTVLERASIASGASSKSFGWINANFPESRNYFNLRLASLQEHKVLQSLYGDLCQPVWGGGLWWELEGAAFDDHITLMKNYDYPLRQIERDEFMQLEPKVANPPEQCILYPQEGAVDGVSCARAMLSIAQSHGAKVITGSDVTELFIRNARCIGVKSSIGQFNADQVVIAMGTQTGVLLNSVNLELPMDNEKGLIVHTNPVEPVLNHLILSNDLHYRQQRDGSIVAADYYSGSALDEDASSLANSTINRLSQCLPDVSGLDVAQITIGERPMPADGFPVIGEINSMPGLYVCVMHSGVTLAPIVGKLATSEIVFGDEEPLLEPFRFERFIQ